jgi:hypothetical protein
MKKTNIMKRRVKAESISIGKGPSQNIKNEKLNITSENIVF